MISHHLKVDMVSGAGLNWDACPRQNREYYNSRRNILAMEGVALSVFSG